MILGVPHVLPKIDFLLGQEFFNSQNHSLISSEWFVMAALD